MTSLVKRCSITPEPHGNQSGTVAGPIGSGEGPPQRGAPPAEPTTGTNRIATASLESDADRYTRAMTYAATAWIAAHPSAYRRMVDGTMGQYRGQPGEFALRMAGLMRACADAAGFPCFRTWLERAA